MIGGGLDDDIDVLCAPSDGAANENQSSLSPAWVIVVLVAMGALILILTFAFITSICCFISVKKEYEKTNKDLVGVTNQLTMLRMQQSSAEYEVLGADYRGQYQHHMITINILLLLQKVLRTEVMFMQNKLLS